MRGPPVFTRIVFAPMRAQPSSQRLAVSMPALRASASRSAMLRGALFET